MKLGFTGTQIGMTTMQLLKVAQFITRNKITDSHSGDCIGADKEFYELVTLANENKDFPRICRFGHIPSNNSKRAFCKYDVEREPKPYLERNHNIVNESDYMIATPKEKEEQLRSGTWATIRYSKKVDKKGMIVYPDGTIESF